MELNYSGLAVVIRASFLKHEVIIETSGTTYVLRPENLFLQTSESYI